MTDAAENTVNTEAEATPVAKQNKYEIALEVYNENPGADRTAVVKAMMERLDTNRKNASTYYGRIQKDLAKAENA